MSFRDFDCQIYIARHEVMRLNLPVESGPQKVARLEPIEHSQLIDPAFRRLLAAFESVPRPLAAV
jgi:hypothetical protein